jgi:phosphoglycerate dehydrogenase-like enzyme
MTKEHSGPNEVPSLVVLDDYLGTAQAHFQHIPSSSLEVVILSTHFPLTAEVERDAFVEHIKRFTMVSTMRERTPFPGWLLRRLPNLKLLLCTGTQFETFDLNTARELGVSVSTAPGRGRTDGPQGSRHNQDIKVGGNHPATHHTWALILALARNVATDDMVMKAGGWQTNLAVGLADKTLGIVGLGRLGAAVARIGILAFGMKVVCWSESLDQEKADGRAVDLGLPVEDERGEKTFKAVTKAKLFATADVVSIHYVLSERSRGVVGAQDIAVMKRDALLVNTARGALVDEAALYQAAEHGLIRGVALDVFSHEPLPEHSPWRNQAWGQGGRSHVLLTPHMGYVEEGIMNAWYAETAENVERWLEGREILNRLV